MLKPCLEAELLGLKVCQYASIRDFLILKSDFFFICGVLLVLIFYRTRDKSRGLQHARQESIPDLVS